MSAVDGPITAGDFGEPHTNGACDHEGQCALLAVWSEVGHTMRTYLDSYTPGRHGRARHRPARSPVTTAG